MPEGLRDWERGGLLERTRPCMYTVRREAAKDTEKREIADRRTYGPMRQSAHEWVCEQLSQELAENDLQTDPEDHLHPQLHLSTPIITLFPPRSDE